jgi:hypothetical protein
MNENELDNLSWSVFIHWDLARISTIAEWNTVVVFWGKTKNYITLYLYGIEHCMFVFRKPKS